MIVSYYHYSGDIVAVCVLLLMLLYNFWNGHVNGYSRGLPMRVKDSIFGRDQHIQDIINLLSFDREELRIVSITGSPGFGKSTIAMIVGHQLIYQGINVYYVSLNELTSIDDLVRELYSYRLEGGQPTIRDVLDSKDRLSSVKTELSPRHLSKWGETLQENTVLIIDNSDTWLNPEEQKMEFKKVVKFLRDSSMHLKLLVTSRQRFLQLGNFHLYPRLSKLDEKAAYRVIKSIIPEANMSLCEKISALSGNVPLALQLVSSLLKQKTDEYVMKELRDSLLFDHEDLQDLDSEERINDTIHISVQYLREDLQRAAEYLSLFPGSFTSESACFILKSIFESFTDIYCRNGLEKLVKYSLLEIGDDRFFYHSLLRKFFLQVGNIKDSKTFHISFNKYFIKLLLRILNSPSSDMDAAEIFNLERHNIQQMLSSLIEFGNHHQMIELAYGVHSVIHDKDLYNPFSTNEAIELIGTEISYLVTNCQSMLESSSSEYVRVYVFLVSDLLEMHDGISSYHQLLSRMSDNMSKCIQSISFEDLSHQYNELQFKVVKKIFLLSDLPMK